MTTIKSMLDSLIMRNMVRKIISFYLDDMKNEINKIKWWGWFWEIVRWVWFGNLLGVFWRRDKLCYDGEISQ